MKNKKTYITVFLAFIITLFFPYISVFASDDELTFNNLKLYSESAILMDSKTGKIIYNKDGKEKKYPASTTKILTAILTLENCENLDEVVTVDYDSIMSVPAGYAVAALQVGEEISVKQLLQVMLIYSANDAANVLAKHIGGSIENFSDMMNKKAKELGCKNSHFVNPNGKHDENHYSTAYDLALIMNYCIKNPTFVSLASSKSCIIPATNKYAERIFTNTNEMLIMDTREVESNYYYPYVIAGKTGYTAEAKNCLVSAASKDGLDLICVVLGGIRTDEGLSAKFTDTKHLFECGYKTYTIKKLREKGAIAQQVEVKDATIDTRNLDLLITDDITVLIKQKDIETTFEPEIEITKELVAPINKGDIIGKIKYTIEDVNYESDITASHSVEKNNFIFFIFQLMLIGFIGFVAFKFYLSKNDKNKKYLSEKNNYYKIN